jgi:hypothetical protein
VAPKPKEHVWSFEVKTGLETSINEEIGESDEIDNPEAEIIVVTEQDYL